MVSQWEHISSSFPDSQWRGPCAVTTSSGLALLEHGVPSAMSLVHRHLFDFSGMTSASAAPELPERACSWPSGPRATSIGEASLQRLLILSHSETGRGRDLPVERINAIEAAASAVGMSLSGAMSLRRQLLRASAARSKKSFYATSAMGSEAGQQAHADATEVYHKWQWALFYQVRALILRRRLLSTPVGRGTRPTSESTPP